jgi:hypothetical protein
VEIIGPSCFSDCSSLAEVIFAVDAKLVRIEEFAFSRCSSLHAIALPPLVEYVGRFCFSHCRYLLALTFSSPCRIREWLDVPPMSCFGQIPDSVEILDLTRWCNYPRGFVVDFGHESRLTKTMICDLPNQSQRCFLRLSSRSLKLFRSNLEFGGE